MWRGGGEVEKEERGRENERVRGDEKREGGVGEEEK